MTVINLGDHAVIHWENKSFTLAERPLFLEKSAALLNGTKKDLLIEFSGLEFLNAGGIGTLVAAYKHVAPRGGSVTLCALPGHLRFLFSLTNTEQFFKFAESLEEVDSRRSPRQAAG